jgi:lysophospholipase
VQALQAGSPGSSVWQFQNSIFQGPKESGVSILNTASYYGDIKDQVDQKSKAGFNTSITDYWGRALSYQLINATDGGPAYTFSSIALQDSFANAQTPFPMLVADGRSPGDTIISLNATLYEFNPFEMGSWDPTTYGFAPLRYLGSKFKGGVLPASESCVRGFDNAGYVMGTSSSLFNQFLLRINGTTSGLLTDALTSVLKDIGNENNDIAQYQPNPFYHFNNATNRDAFVEELSLVDGGEDLQNIPLYPLIQPFRAVDVIFAVDSSADTTYIWPNGTALVASYERSLNDTIQNHTAFPAIPDVNTMVNLGLNQHPTFFGCNAANTTTLSPLIVYIPNAPYITHSNVSTFDPAYNTTQRNLIIRNGYDVATLGNGTLDAQWPTCVACAVLSRSFFKTGTAVPDACQTCFNRYCWNGSLNATTPNNYDPAFKLAEVSDKKAGAGALRVGWGLGVVVAMVMGVMVV